MSDEINMKPKSKELKLFILIAALVIAGLTIAAVILGVSKTATAKKVEKQLSLGEKYLSELEYEQAIAAYENALKIDPKNTDAYLGLADVYMAMGDYDKAEEILEEAKDVIKKAEDKDRIKRKEKKVTKDKETEQKTPPSPTPTFTPTSSPTPTPTKAPSSGKVEALKKASVGDYITFGTYEQDNNLNNGAEPIEWLVLEKKDGKALVLSKYALDCKKYNEEYEKGTWENCTLRSWLNDEFYTTAFNKTERSAIVQTLIKNKDNPYHGTEGGNDTKDKVFLLSIEEVTTYFDSDPDEYDPARRAKVTEYAKAQGGWYSTSDEYYGNGWWWLRSPGLNGNLAALVYFDGSVVRSGRNVDNILYVVRPALWISYAEQESTPTEAPSSGKVEDLKKASVGDHITFGTYEQDNNLNNGAEPIEWLVLEKKDGKALVLSKYALDAKPYNEEDVDVTWETCTLRSWLNEEFYTAAFNKTERAAVVQTLIKNEDNSKYGTEGGNDTKDKVFLLSIEEVTTYFDPDPDEEDPARRVKLTEYAIAQGGRYDDDKDSEYYGNGWWWLRSPGLYSSYAAGVISDGYVSRHGDVAVSSRNVVRPALWLAYTEQESTPTETPSSGKAEAMKKASVGDYITFGTYEQDNNLSNGAEPIEWLVLEKKDGKALVLSKYSLDAKLYNEKNVDVTWETCTLRSWLNEEFYTTAFNKTERAAVVQTLIKNKDNPEYGTEGGNDTKDKVFLLSIEEVTTYFDPDPDKSDPARRAQVTEYAKAQGGWYSTSDECYGNGCWWLRSPGNHCYDAAGVDYFGYVYLYGAIVGDHGYVVRPALWLAY